MSNHSSVMVALRGSGPGSTGAAVGAGDGSGVGGIVVVVGVVDGAAGSAVVVDTGEMDGSRPASFEAAGRCARGVEGTSVPESRGSDDENGLESAPGPASGAVGAGVCCPAARAAAMTGVASLAWACESAARRLASVAVWVAVPASAIRPATIDTVARRIPVRAYAGIVCALAGHEGRGATAEGRPARSRVGRTCSTSAAPSFGAAASSTL